ncbi:MAG: PCYCGC motif-containing (lipo)protein [Methanoregula sp.]|jgi:hypothetical protein|uniref:PCYCGC motif-containing (lipo)protein n=1 Tax=Methanoregula sp. TaxID=2052170 RepID=UPI003D123923
MDKKYLISILMIIALAGVTMIVFLPQGTQSSPDSSGLPEYALASDRIKEAYLFARDNPEKLDGITCYCGCMQMAHNGRIHKRGLLDCFIKEDGEYESHGAYCQMCVDDTLQVKGLYAQGMGKTQIQAIIDAKHANGT